MYLILSHVYMLYCSSSANHEGKALWLFRVVFCSLQAILFVFVCTKLLGVKDMSSNSFL